MRVAVGTGWGGTGVLQPLAEDGTPTGRPEHVQDLVAAVADRERAERPRWVWPATSELYPAVLAQGVQVARCHDLALTEAILLGHHGRWGEPRSLGAAWARLRGLPVPDDPPPQSRESQPTLFEAGPTRLPGDAEPVTAVAEVYADQLRRIGAVDQPGALRLLAAAESAGGLAAVEMGRHGLPWRSDVHDALLTELLGPRPVGGGRPEALRTLAERISEALGGRPVNPDSPAELVRAFAREGVELPSTRSWVLREVRHPAAALVLQYKELARLHSAHGWSWLGSWVHDGRFHPEYVAGGVVSGRWATRGGGALQIPRAVRRAVIADPGWVLVVADARQLEPRVLAALAGDEDLAATAADGDLYTALAGEAFGEDRHLAKVALLSAMYGGGDQAALATLRRRFPRAVGFVEAAARAGEQGLLVRSRLGRTCPPPSDGWRDVVGQAGDAAAERRAAAAMRDRGRFTRNFVVQASAADWALVLLAGLRQRLAALPVPAELVFFLHDEVIVHCAGAMAEQVSEAVVDSADQAGRLVFGDTPVRFPLGVSVVTSYAEAK